VPELVVTSRIGLVADGLATAIAAASELGEWGLPPRAEWFPDFDRSDLSEGGLQCWVFPSTAEPALVARGIKTAGSGLHVSIFKPMLEGSADFIEGDQVVYRAEQTALWLLKKQIETSVCTEVKHEPVISREFARGYRVWLSLLQTTWVEK